MCVSPVFRSVSSSVVARIADDEEIAATLLGPLAFDREAVQLAERAAQHPHSAACQRMVEATLTATAHLARALVTRAEVGPYVLLDQGCSALSRWAQSGGPDVIGVVMRTGRALRVDLGYDAIRLQRTQDFAPILAILERVDREWNALVGAGSEPKLGALEEHALAARYIGQIQSLYRDAMHRSHAVLAGCS
jgi:hypothetical protein